MSDSQDVEIIDEPLCLSEEEEQQQKVAEAEEEYDPCRPEELQTTAQLAESQEREAEDSGISLGSQDSTDCSDEKDEDDEDDSIVDDEIHYSCKDHKFCIEYAKELDAFLLRTLQGLSTVAERQSALAEVLCDFYRK